MVSGPSGIRVRGLGLVWDQGSWFWVAVPEYFHFRKPSGSIVKISTQPYDIYDFGSRPAQEQFRSSGALGFEVFVLRARVRGFAPFAR